MGALWPGLPVARCAAAKATADPPPSHPSEQKRSPGAQVRRRMTTKKAEAEAEAEAKATAKAKAKATATAKAFCANG